MAARTTRDRWDPRASGPRLPGLLVGLVLFGLGIALMAQAGLGRGPWEAFHQGIGRQTGIELGTNVFAFGIGPVVQWALGIFDREGAVLRRRRELATQEAEPLTLVSVESAE
ncbi:MAG: hypothetical protein A2X23_01115 [Chloroflexi bacterium GWC2_73_18]|nr:MAG: hypothetical protein A2X23_01115 [Chloroflexi bacterium GWC2_73_18]